MITDKKTSELQIARNAFLGKEGIELLKNKIFEAFERVIIPELKKSKIKSRHGYPVLKILFSYKTNDVLVLSENELKSYESSSNLILDDLFFVSEINMDYFTNHPLFSSIFKLIHFPGTSDDKEDQIKDKVDKLFTKRVFNSISDSFLELSEVDFDDLIAQEIDFSVNFLYEDSRKAEKVQRLLLNHQFPVRFVSKDNLFKFFLRKFGSELDSKEVIESDRFISQDLREYLYNKALDEIKTLNSLNNHDFFLSLKELGNAKFVSKDDIISRIYERLKQIKNSEDFIDVKSASGLESIIQMNTLLGLNPVLNGKGVVDSISDKKLLELLEIASSYQDYFDPQFIKTSRIYSTIFKIMFQIVLSELGNRNYSGLTKLSIPFDFIDDLSKDLLSILSRIDEIELSYLKPHEIFWKSKIPILNEIKKIPGKISIPKDTELNLNLLLDSVEKGAILSEEGSVENGLKLLKEIISSWFKK